MGLGERSIVFGDQGLRRGTPLAGFGSALYSGARSARAGTRSLAPGDGVCQGRYDQAETCWGSHCRSFGAWVIRPGCLSHGNLGLVADAQGDYEGASASYEEALALFRQLDANFIATCCTTRVIAYFQGHHDRAWRCRRVAGAGARVGGSKQHCHDASATWGSWPSSRVNTESPDASARGLDARAQTHNKPWLARGIEHFALIRGRDE